MHKNFDLKTLKFFWKTSKILRLKRHLFRNIGNEEESNLLLFGASKDKFSTIELPPWKKISKPRNSLSVKDIIVNSWSILAFKRSNSECYFNTYQVCACI